jgi:hypothetical protein
MSVYTGKILLKIFLFFASIGLVLRHPREVVR